tara:strand:- start:1104 stop:1388 length:285 start_codon:yes stop_codon:yes gene_type:complete
MKILFLLILPALSADRETCGEVVAYHPPRNSIQPHRVTMNNIDLIFWPEDLSTLEFYPWELVLKKVCAYGQVKTREGVNPFITIRVFNQIKIIN